MLKKEFSLTLDGITFYVTRKPIKNMYIRVTSDRRVNMTVPARTPLDVISDFATGSLPRVKKLLQNTPVRSADLSDGSEISLLGTSYTVRHISGAARDSIRLDTDGHMICVMLRSPPTEPLLTRLYRHMLHDIMTEHVPSRFEYWRQLMSIAEPVSLSFRYMVSIHGNCHIRQRHIKLSTLLAHRSPRFIDCIIVHELAHLRCRGHDSRFYAEVLRYIPDYHSIVGR